LAIAPEETAIQDQKLAVRLQATLEGMFAAFPWCVRVEDWNGHVYDLGGSAPHWSGWDHMSIRLSPDGGRDLLGLNMMKFLDRFVSGEVGMEGNLYLLGEIRNYLKLKMRPIDIIKSRMGSRVMEAPERAQSSVKSHYDIPQRSLFYLDRVYQSYSCAMWEEPDDLGLDGLLRVGNGEHDDWDSLERAQWKKFAHAADFLAPEKGETVLDVGCGYPGFLQVMMDRHPGAERVVGWTHSTNQVQEGEVMLKEYDPARFELNEGDYREDNRPYDHIHSTGMISHVGPPGKDSGLLNYVQHIRSRIRTGGRYVHHALMDTCHEAPLFDYVGPAFNRKYVWPGFYWYTLGEHIKTLEENGFQVVQVLNLSPHYGKTTRAWYERMVQDSDRFIKHASESTYRAWQFFLAGSSGSLFARQAHCYRVLCEATDIDVPSRTVSDPAQNAISKIPIQVGRR
jgi:cyclopropane fatty-acyl-phospholipid synthase-like methyltransferase